MAEELVDEKPLDEEPAELTDEDLDRIADTAIGALQDILKYFEVGEVTIDEYEGDEGELILDITGDDLAVLIGRHEKLESIARSPANRAASQNRSIKLRPMTPYERRIVHICLRDDDRVETASEGEGSARHVVILPR